MRLCYVGDGWSVHLHRWLSWFVRRGHEMSLITFRPIDRAFPGREQVRIVHLPYDRTMPVVSFPFKLPVVRRAVRALQPDLVHGHSLLGYGLWAAASGHHPLVVSAWGDDLLQAAPTRWTARRVARFVFRRADILHVFSRCLADAAVRLGAPAERLRLIVDGIEPDRFAPPSWQPRPPVVVSTRWHAPVYNLPLLLEAIPRVLAEVPEAQFFIAGDGPLRRAHEQWVAERGLGLAVHFLGKVDYEAMPELLQRAAVYVSTSLSDGLHKSLFEAQAAGAYPVVTEIEANRPWIEDGRTGSLVPLGDPEQLAQRIVEALQDPERSRTAAGKNLALIRERASFERNMPLIEALYEELLVR